MKIFNNLIQGSEKWKEVRKQYFTASEAPAMMNCSKYMSRNELLKLKKTGNEKPVTPALQAIFDRGHATEARARPIIEKLIDDELYPVTGVLEDTKYLASFDGLTMFEEIVYEHKLWNEALAENVRNLVLEPMYYWQLEQQLFVSGADVAYFVVSDGTEEKMVHMKYKSVPDRRLELIAGWIQFRVDLENFEVEAIKETALPTVIKALPIINYKVEGTMVTSNIGNCLETLRERSQLEMNRSLETDQDFADKNSFNKSVKKARDDLKLLAVNVQNQFQSHAEFVVSVKEADTILQKMQSHGEKQVTDAKEAKKKAIRLSAEGKIIDHTNDLNTLINPVLLASVLAFKPDFETAMKNKRTIESLQNAVDSVVAEFKIEANAVADKVKLNLISLRELGNDYKFLFNDINQLVTKDNEDLVAVIKTRIADHKAEEGAKLEAQREEIRLEEEAKAKEKVEAEQREKEAEKQRIEDEEIAKERGRIAKETADKREEETSKVEEDLPFVDQEESVPCGTSNKSPQNEDIKGFLEWAVNDKGIQIDFGYLLISDNQQHNEEALHNIKFKFSDYLKGTVT